MHNKKGARIPVRIPAECNAHGASLKALLEGHKARRLSSRAAAIPEPANKTPTTAGSKDTAGVPPVSGNAVALDVPPVSSAAALAVAVGVELAVGVALEVDGAPLVGEAVAVGLDIMSSPVGLSSKARPPPLSSAPRSSLLGLSSKPRSPPRSSSCRLARFEVSPYSHRTSSVTARALSAAGRMDALDSTYTQGATLAVGSFICQGLDWLWWNCGVPSDHHEAQKGDDQDIRAQLYDASGPLDTLRVGCGYVQ